MSTGIKRVYAIFYDQSEDHICAWTDNQLEVPATYNAETESYELSTTALAVTSWYQPNHKYAVTLFAEDEAGNVGSVGYTDETYGSQLNFRVKEKLAPTVTFVSPSDGAIIGDADADVIFSLTDGDETNIGSGIDTNTFALTVGAQSFTWDDVVAVEDQNNQYKVHVTNMAGGSVTTSLSVSDNDENQTTQSMSFVVQTVGPELFFVEPASDILVGKDAPTNYPIVLKVKPNGSVALTKLVLLHKYRGNNSGGSEPNYNHTQATYEITEFGTPDENGYYTVTQEIRLQGNAFNAYKTCYTYNDLTATAYDAIDNSTNVSRTITVDNADPVIYDVTTENVNIVASSGKIKIQFRIFEGPPAPTMTIVESNRPVYDGSHPYDSMTLEVGDTYQPYAIAEQRPHVDMGVGLQSGYRIQFEKPTAGTTDFLPLTTTLLDDSTSEVGRYRVELSEPMVLTNDDVGAVWKDMFFIGSKRYPHLKDASLSPGKIYVAPKMEILSVTPDTVTYPMLSSVLPEFKIKITPASAAAPTGAYLAWNGNTTETNISPTITKIDAETTSEYAVYTIKSTKTISSFSWKIIDYYSDQNVSYKLKIVHPAGNVYREGVVSYIGCKVEIFDVSSVTTTIDYVPTFKVKVTPDFGDINAISMQFGTKSYATKTTKFTSIKDSYDDYAIHTFTATEVFGPSVTGLIDGNYTTIAQNIKIKVSPFSKDWEQTGTLTYEAPPFNVEVISAPTAYTSRDYEGIEPFYYPSITYKVVPKGSASSAFIRFPNAACGYAGANGLPSAEVIKSTWFELTDKTVDSSNSEYDLVTARSTHRFSGECGWPSDIVANLNASANSISETEDNNSDLSRGVSGGYHPLFLSSGSYTQKFRIYNDVSTGEYTMYENTLVVTTPPVIKLFDITSIEPYAPVGIYINNGTISVYSDGSVEGNISVNRIPISYIEGAALTVTITNVACTFPEGFGLSITDGIGYGSDLDNVDYTKSDPDGSYDGLTGMVDTTERLENNPETDFSIFFIIEYKDGDTTKVLNSDPVFLYKRDYSSGAN